MKIILITGLPGSGKTTLGRQLAQRWRLPLLAKDDIKGPLLEAFGDRETSRSLSNASFAVLFSLAQAFASVARDMVLEGNFRPGEHEAALQAILAAGREAILLQILCRVDEAQRLQRIRNRRADRDPRHQDADPAVIADRSADAFLDLPGTRLESDPSDAEPLMLRIERWWRESPAARDV